jgi:hypothetical protein
VRGRAQHHWLIVNIRGNDIKTGEVMSDYIGAAPPKGAPPRARVAVLI